MKQITKNKVLIIVWILILVPLAFLNVFNKSLSAWAKGAIIAMWIMTAVFNILRAIRENKDFSLADDVLIIRQTFLKEQRYNLMTIKSWAEYHYKFLGINTGRKIILKTASGIRINLNDNSNSEPFEKLSDYLNSNLSDINEN